jgi:hypothetical protein
MGYARSQRMRVKLDRCTLNRGAVEAGVLVDCDHESWLKTEKHWNLVVFIKR